ncbi:MAG TPA: protein kinase [Gemmatimonadales bacterium]|nr:protein kinase [Gemmatimonadales bacterium]
MSEFQDRLQDTLGSQYRLERELGGGGMSRVFLAEEVALARKVVIKVLPPEMVSGVNQDRFRREIQLAARLQHPHIVPLLAAGAAGDVLWYAMPFIEGESLRVKLARGGELPVVETVRILREVADALAYAHTQGVVHRDIKPDNVLLSGRHALVTDFGVAKAVSESSKDHTLTSLGLALGTPAYMAPEQASADPHVDHRADLYALGAMAYEMLAGDPPFSGMSPQSILAAHVTKVPAPVASHRPAVPAALNEIVMRCLEKRAADRWQSAEELMPHLDALLTPSGGTAPTGAVASISSGTEAAIRKSHPVRVAVLFGLGSIAVLAGVNFLVNKIGLPGWVLYAAVGLLIAGFPIILATSLRERRRLLARTTGTRLPAAEGGLGGLLTWRRALAGGGLAFAGLAVGAAVFMGLRAAGIGPFATLLSAGVIKARDPLVVADFENRTSDSTLAQSVTEALRIDLARSPTVQLLETADVATALRRMEKDPGTALTAQVAREVAERAGAAAVVTGEIASLGAGYVLSVRLVATKDGATLLAERETAANAGGLIEAVDKLSKKVREGIGESLRTIRGGQPLEEVTTASLEALRKYSQANRAADEGQQVKARDLVEEALRLDPNFAMAHRKMAVIVGNMGGDNARVIAESRKAFELRDRLPEMERLLATAYYYWNIDYDSDKVIAAYRQVLETWPDERTSLNNLAVELNVRGLHAEAAEVALHGVRVSPSTGVLWVNAIESLVPQGDFATADSLYQEWGKVQVGNAQRYSTGFRLAFAEAKYDMARIYADSSGQRSDPSWQARSHHQRANVFRVRGQLTQADKEELIELEMARGMGAKGQALRAGIDYAFTEATFRKRPATALKRVDSLLNKLPLESMDTLERPYLNLSDLFVHAGEVGRAERMLAEYDRVVPAEIRKGDFQRIYSGALLAYGKQQYADAIAGFRQFRDKNGGFLIGQYEIARAFDDMGQPDSARVAYEEYVTRPENGPSGRQYDIPAAYGRLGTLYEEKGNKDKALEYYGKLTALWKDADPDLQPRVTEVKKRMAALAGEPARSP